MRYLYIVVFFLLSFFSVKGASVPFVFDDQWPDSLYNYYEDSLRNALYPMPILKVGIEDINESANQEDTQINPYFNELLPEPVVINKTLGVGEIPMTSEVSSTGAKIYKVPLDLPEGLNGFQPQLSLNYHSQRLNSIMGLGWSLDGISTIERTVHNTYYDAFSSGIDRSYNDAFTLDGQRLIHIGDSGPEADDLIFETETGNVKARAHINQDGSCYYFDVFFPDGRKATYGLKSTKGDYAEFPLTSIEDINGNEIIFSYYVSYDKFILSEIKYNGYSISFDYYHTRPDEILTFIGGQKVIQKKLLKSIAIRDGNTELLKYSFSYGTTSNQSTLSKIDLFRQGKSVNPLLFAYGLGNEVDSLIVKKSNLPQWYTSDNIESVLVGRGRFIKESAGDGFLFYPNRNPFWAHCKDATSISNSQNYLVNMFTGDEDIIVYRKTDRGGIPDWGGNTKTGTGFTDLLVADVYGYGEEQLVKVSCHRDGDKDKVGFLVYQPTDSGIVLKKTVVFEDQTIYTDASGNKSVQPKYFFAGDFIGNGSSQIMSISMNMPFGATYLPSKTVIYDILSGRKLMTSTLLKLSIELVGTKQQNARQAYHNSDKIFIMDYDGDGKSDICHLDKSGMHIYSVDMNAGATALSLKNVANNDCMNRAFSYISDLAIGDFNGDGLSDIVKVIKTNDAEEDDLIIYFSKGDGTFETHNINAAVYNKNQFNCLAAQDFNGDGFCDLAFAGNDNIDLLMMRNSSVIATIRKSNEKRSRTIIPLTYKNRLSVSDLLAFSNGEFRSFHVNCNTWKESLLTSSTNSFGIIEQNDYSFINDREVYKETHKYDFPYSTISESWPVVKSTTLIYDNKTTSKSFYEYFNAAYHKKGLGFCGFDKIICRDQSGDELVRIYDPCNYGVLLSDSTKYSTKKYKYDINISDKKIKKILLKEKVERDKTNGFFSTVLYRYDQYGNTTVEDAYFSDGWRIKVAKSYFARSDIDSVYCLDFLTDQTVTKYSQGRTYMEREKIDSFSKRSPLYKTQYIDGSVVKQQKFEYDAHGNTIAIYEKPYNHSVWEKTDISRDNRGRITSVSDFSGLTESFSYDEYGQSVSITDCRGGLTSIEYDEFGREILKSYSDGGKEKISWAWASGVENALYSITKSASGKPTTIDYYDVFHRIVHSREIRADGSWLKKDFSYNYEGQLSSETHPYKGAIPDCCDYFYYDNFERLNKIAYADGGEKTFKYSGAWVKISDRGRAYESHLDSQGNTIYVEENGCMLEYVYHPDGQIISTYVNGQAFEIFTGYDKYRRKISVRDPAHGTDFYEYNSLGLLSKEINAKGDSISYEYDANHRLIKKTTAEVSTQYSYNAFGDLLSKVSSNGTSTQYTYSADGKLTSVKEFAPDGVWLQKDISYSNTLPSKIKYTSQSGVLGTEKLFFNRYNHLYSIELDDELIYEYYSEDERGNPDCYILNDRITVGNFTDDYGLPTSSKSYYYYNPTQTSGGGKTVFPWEAKYSFDPVSHNMSSKQERSCLKESYSYDSFNRLTSYGDCIVSYDYNGNILSKSDVGTYDYSHLNENAVSEITPFDGSILSAIPFEASYTSFKRPRAISRGDFVASFVYNDDYDRVKMSVSHPEAALSRTKYYLGGCYERTVCGDTIRELLYIGGDYYSAYAVLIKENNQSNISYIVRDYQGSVCALIGKGYTQYSYDAWGNLRDPQTLSIVDPRSVDLLIGRGYCGHEHLPEFGWINMNARLYDPAIGRFLSPDPLVQQPFNVQNHNFYTYCLNNPLAYVDEDGEFFWTAVGIAAIIGGTVNVALHWKEIKAAGGGWNSFLKGASYFAVGGVAAGVGTALSIAAAPGIGFSGMLGATSETISVATMGFSGGAISGAVGGASEGFILDTSNALLAGESVGKAFEAGAYGALWSGISAGIGGGISGAYQAYHNGSNLWQESNKIKLDLNETSTEGGWYLYVGKNKLTDEMGYVGITRRPPQVRWDEHLRSHTIRATFEYSLYSKVKYPTLLAARIAEQKLINKYGLRKNGGILYNKRNEIAPSKWAEFGIFD